MSNFDAHDLKPRTESFGGWEVPDGFETLDLVQIFGGPILGADGTVVEHGPREYRWGVAHVFDDGELRIVVRPGDRDQYSASGWYMEIQSLVGTPGQHFSNVHAALTQARAEVREHQRLQYRAQKDMSQ